MTASAPGSGPTGLGDVSFEDLGDFEVAQSGDRISVEGTLNAVEWPEFSSRESDRTGYYVTLLLDGADGAFVGKTTPSNDWKYSAVEDCADGWVVAVREGQKSFTFQVFGSEEDAASKSNGKTYTVDLSGVSYGE